ncbi:MAG: glutamate racemase [Hyphomonadaceae bacterium]|nr:glutamate racemase [Hyphomonadaceae bacterium]MBC6411958.1 glutamate racemase [Hyphomonadaceae bacterium]
MTHVIIFDSGVGGLSVSAQVRALLPNVRQSYIADDAFRPYGEKSGAELQARLPGLLRTLEALLAPDVIVIACNTASTAALSEIREAVNVPVVGVVPAIKPAAGDSRTKVIGILGTPGTVHRDYVDQLIADFADDCRVVLHGSTRLVQMSEDKLSGIDVSPDDLRAEITLLFKQAGAGKIDHIVLACTHFPLLKSDLAKVTPHEVTWIDSGEAIARRVKTLVRNAEHKSGMEDTAFLIGGRSGEARSKAFGGFGFHRVVSLPDYDPENCR